MKFHRAQPDLYRTTEATVLSVKMKIEAKAFGVLGHAFRPSSSKPGFTGCETGVTAFQTRTNGTKTAPSCSSSSYTNRSNVALVLLEVFSDNEKSFLLP